MLYGMCISLFLLLVVLKNAMNKFKEREGYGKNYDWAGKETNKYC